MLEKNFDQKSTEFMNLFMHKYYNLLSQRKDSFLKIFHHLISLRKESYFILETGMCRLENNFSGDGMSTILWDEFVNILGGQVYSVDLNPETVRFAKNKVSNKTLLFCSDSVSLLHQLSLKEDLPIIDLLYLDSFDLDWNNPHPSSLHHFKEILAIKSKIKENCLIMIDDNAMNKGKGKYVDDFMSNINKEKIINDYQIAWKW
jgi:hypothetical protein